MQFSVPLTSILVFAASIGIVIGGPICTSEWKNVSIRWRVFIPEAQRMGNVCHRFWIGLKQFPLCVVTPIVSCGPQKGEETTLFAIFHTSIFCNSGMVEAAFWEATDNKFGSVSCLPYTGDYLQSEQIASAKQLETNFWMSPRYDIAPR